MDSKATSQLNQYLTFILGNELFALDIAKVREIVDEKNITKVPRMPKYLRGVINLRGHPVPVVDLRLNFGMSETLLGLNTCVIITELELEGDKIHIGALADAVQEVMEIAPDRIDPAPRMGTAIDANYIKGMAKLNDQFIMILDIDRIFTPEQFGELKAAKTV